jgi:hypothetical protein
MFVDQPRQTIFYDRAPGTAKNIADEKNLHVGLMVTRAISSSVVVDYRLLFNSAVFRKS